MYKYAWIRKQPAAVIYVLYLQMLKKIPISWQRGLYEIGDKNVDKKCGQISVSIS